MDRYDAIIVGGRIARSAMATHLARQGERVVGDAAGYIDSITSQDIHDSLRAAELLALAWARVRNEAGWERRDSETAAMYAFTDRLASFEPLTPETEQLFRAIAANPALATQYVGIYNLVTDPNEFFAQFQQAA
ncbi:MAG: hypothetical protein IT307_04610 [Chloroflexi bacterium]|nr:hypothetical protein [Chloroflexota bacterium]